MVEELLGWYSENKRDLPWRDTKEPYLVWVSEIILQQTQVKQGLPYFNRFVKEFPDVFALAQAPEDKVLKLWEGLGYYSRARNLHAAAKYVVNELGGQFPKNYKDLLKMKGVGDYTASAIASFCYKEVVPVVDGNVLRVISRYFGVEKAIDLPQTHREIKEICTEIIPQDKPDLFNQAIMEFGALQCTPKQVNCEVCPLQNSCWVYLNKKVDELPFKTKKIKKRTRYFYFFLIENKGKYAVKKRSNQDIWKGLYELPLHEATKSVSESEILKQYGTNNVSIYSISPYYKHLLSHQTIYAKFFHLKNIENHKDMGKFYWLNQTEIKQKAFPKLIENYLNETIYSR